MFWKKISKIIELHKEVKSIRQEVREEIGNIAPGSKEELRLEYAGMYKSLPVNDRVILYESYAGRGLVCNPYGIFKRFTKRNDFGQYTHVWVLENLDKQKDIVDRYSEYKNVVFVQRDTVEYCKYLVQAKFLITNLSFPNYYTKKEGQIYINTWHGIPLKTLGFDIPNGRITGLNTIRNFLAVDVFLSPNRFMTDIFRNTFRLEGLFEGHIMESGTARNDNLFYGDREEVLEKLKAEGVKIDPSKKIIMYAPTWKGEKYSDPDTSTDMYFELINKVEESVDTDKYQILIKPHQIVYKNIVDKGEVLTDKFIPATIDANEILSIVDVLISDYSSIYFDYLATEKPIIFYIPDLEEYKEQRGLYFGVDKLPGPIAQSLEELGNIMSDIPAATENLKKKYLTEKKWACGNDDGSVSERVINKIIVNKDFTDMELCDHTSKKKVLIYTGLLKNEKKKAAFDDFLNKFDFDKFDLTLIVPHKEDEEFFEWIRNVDKRVRVLRRTGTYAADEREKECIEIIKRHGKDDPDYQNFYSRYYPKEVYEREKVRIVGQTHFDYIIEYTKKSEFFKNVFKRFEGAKVLKVSDLNMFEK